MERRDFLKNLFKVAAYSQIAGLADTLQEDVNADKRSGKGVQITRRPYRQTGMTLPLLGFGAMRLPGKNGKIDLAAPRLVVHNLIRGTNPWPGAYALLGEEKLKLWRTELSDAEPPADLPVGGLFGDQKRGLFLRCTDGALEITELQAPGGKKLDGKSFLRGKNIAGSVLS